jgi:hypothetical protein
MNKLLAWWYQFTAYFLNERQVYYNSKFLKKKKNNMRIFFNETGEFMTIRDCKALDIIEMKLSALEQVKKTRRNLYHV